jgi:hypothetical protein
MVAVFAKIILEKYTLRDICICALLNFLGILNWLSTGNATVLLTCIVITAAKDTDYMTILRTSLFIRGGLYIVRTSMAVIGLFDIQERLFVDEYDVSQLRIRYALGYGQPNATHFEFFVIVVLLVLVYGYRLKLWHYVAALLYNYFIFGYTDSRSGFLVTSIFIIMCYMISLKNSLGSVIFNCVKAISNKVFIITAVISAVGAILFFYVDVLQSWGTFSSRFMTSSYVITNNIINLFGNKDVKTDLGMINFLYGDGLIFFILFLAGYYILMKKHNNRDDAFLMVACCCYALYCITEAYADSILMNVTLLAFTEIVYGHKKHALAIVENTIIYEGVR